MDIKTLNKILLGLAGVSGVVALSFVLSGLGELTGVEVTYHSPDQICNECISEVHIKTTYYEICFEHSNREDIVYKKVSTSRKVWINLNKVVLTEPNTPITISVPTLGGKIREMKDGDCLSRYTLANPKINKLFISGNTNGKKVKWGVPFLKLDTVWIGYSVVYENLSKEIDSYKEEKIIVNNLTTSKEETKTIQIPEVKTVYYAGKRLGVKVGETTYLNSNVQDNKIVIWSVPIGDRNFQEYGTCRSYEIEKGVCKEIEIGEILEE